MEQLIDILKTEAGMLKRHNKELMIENKEIKEQKSWMAQRLDELKFAR